jgi:hypothetical protein
MDSSSKKMEKIFLYTTRRSVVSPLTKVSELSSKLAKGAKDLALFQFDQRSVENARSSVRPNLTRKNASFKEAFFLTSDLYRSANREGGESIVPQLVKLF